MRASKPHRMEISPTGTARRSPRRAVVLLAVLGLLLSTAACGARWDDDQRAFVTQGQGAGVRAGISSKATGTAEGAATGADPAAAAQSGAPVDAAGGATAAPGSPEAAAAAAASAKPCAAPSTAPGVTDSEIVLGSISSLSGPVAGLGASSAAAARAYVAYRNSVGGVCGRQLVLKEADDGTDNGRYRSIVNDLGPQVLGIAGGFAMGDVGGVSVIQQQGLPVVNVPGADDSTVLPTVFDINPPFERPDLVIGKYRYLVEQGAQKVSMTYLAVDQSRAEAQKQRKLMEAAGLQVVQVQELPLSTLSYDPAARGVANSGADTLFFIGDTTSNASMAKSMANTGTKLRFAEYFTFAYGTNFIELAGSASEGAVSWLRTLPNEDAGANPEMATFLEWMEQAAPGEPVDVFAADSWAGVKAVVDSLEALPGPISREALVAQLAATETYDAGGMLGPIRLGAEVTNACLVGMRVEGGVWKRMAPAQGFLCT